MPISPFYKYHSFIDELTKGGHPNLATSTYKVALTNTAPSVATDTTWNAGTAPPPTNTGGYPAGGNIPVVVSAGTTSGVFKVVLEDTVFAATGAGIGPFRYALLYLPSNGNKLVGFYDNGGVTSLANFETLTVDFDGPLGVYSLQ